MTAFAPLVWLYQMPTAKRKAHPMTLREQEYKDGEPLIPLQFSTEAQLSG
jgi:hypothetical protein